MVRPIAWLSAFQTQTQALPRECRCDPLSALISFLVAIDHGVRAGVRMGGIAIVDGRGGGLGVSKPAQNRIGRQK
jgi:hypothetical protein